MLRFLHTADWQLGLRVHYIPGDAGALVRAARLQTLDRIGALAREHDVDFVVVAGDVFEHHGLKPATLRQTFDALASWPCPIYLLPGNHDPLTADSLYRSPRWAQAPAQVHLLADELPVTVPLRPARAAALAAATGAAPEVVLLPCPLRERHTLADLTEHLRPEYGPSRAPHGEHPGAFRIGVAHGGVYEMLRALADEDTPLNNPIGREAAERGGLDYLALGDWHSTLCVDARTWYSGAPEPTRFKERDPGHVLRVELAAPGAQPQVTRLPAATQQWRQHEAEINHPADLAPLAAWFEALPHKRNTLVELFLRGAPDAEALNALERLLADFEARCLWLRRRDTELHPLLSADDLDAIATTGWVRGVVETLQGAAHRGDAEAAEALRLLYRLQATEIGGAR